VLRNLRRTAAALARSTERLTLLPEIDRALIAAKARRAGDLEAPRREEPQVVDTAALPRGPDTEALLASGVRTYMVVPIGSVSFGGAPDDFPPEQISIAQEVATQLAIALEQARLLARVQGQAAELEQRARERTLELRSANAQLQRESPSGGAPRRARVAPTGRRASFSRG
jgi:GAF domain-containing protein